MHPGNTCISHYHINEHLRSTYLLPVCPPVQKVSCALMSDVVVCSKSSRHRYRKVKLKINLGVIKVSSTAASATGIKHAMK